MLKTLLHCMLISTAVLAADNSDPFSSPTASSSKSERVILSEESGEPSAKKQRVDTPYETMYMFLPDELITHIATFARIKDGIQMSSTCKNWKQVLDQSDIWQRYASRLAGYTFFKDDILFKKEDGSVDYKKMLPSFTVPIMNIFHSNIKVRALSEDTTFILGGIYEHQISRALASTEEEEGLEEKGVPIPYMYFSPPHPYREGEEYLFQFTEEDLEGKFKEIIEGIEEGEEEAPNAFIYKRYQDKFHFFDTPSHDGQVIAISPDNKVIIEGSRSFGRNSLTVWIQEEGKVIPQEQEENKFTVEEIQTQGLEFGFSRDCKTIVTCIDDKPAVWTLGEGAEFLSGLNGGRVGKARGINNKKNIIVGSAKDELHPHKFRAVKWTNKVIETLPGDEKVESHAFKVNADGSVIIGGIILTGVKRAVKWTTDGLHILEALNEGSSTENEGSFTDAEAISADGKVIVGNNYTYDIHSSLAVRWTEQGIECLTSLLHNFIPQGWVLTTAHYISPDGGMIIGEGKTRVDNSTSFSYLAFVPREDILEKEGLRAHF